MLLYTKLFLFHYNLIDFFEKKKIKKKCKMLGGSGNDLYNKGQNTGDVLGSIIRIDVDSTANGKNYAIPSGSQSF